MSNGAVRSSYSTYGVFMIGVPLGLMFANAVEWVFHKYVLHGLGKRKNSFWSFHWHEHRAFRRNAFRRNAFLDEAHEVAAAVERAEQGRSRARR